MWANSLCSSPSFRRCDTAATSLNRHLLRLFSFDSYLLYGRIFYSFSVGSRAPEAASGEVMGDERMGTDFWWWLFSRVDHGSKAGQSRITALERAAKSGPRGVGKEAEGGIRTTGQRVKVSAGL
ncbi:hypothetical protein NW759_001205 [Fusarium solani]|nr:hypothetical protein NW759_001205 [Fusarium solani]